MTAKANINIDELKLLVRKGMRRKELATHFGVSPKTISVHLSDNNLSLHDLKFNHFAFDKINERSSYWLGFLYADGCLYRDGSTKRIELTLADKDHVRKWHQFLESSNNICSYTLSSGRFQGSIYHSSCHVSENMFDKLIELGCLPKKTFKINFPKLPDEFLHHFVRGYFDGDGCIFWEIKKQRKTQQIGVNIVGTYDLLSGINKISPSHFNIRKHRKSEIYQAEFRGNKKGKAFREWLYRDSEDSIRLTRKYEKFYQFEELINGN